MYTGVVLRINLNDEDLETLQAEPAQCDEQIHAHLTRAVKELGLLVEIYHTNHEPDEEPGPRPV